MSGFLTHGKKGHLKNFFEIFLWLEASKIDQSIVVGWDRDWGRWGCDCKCPRPQVNVPFYFIKMPFIPKIVLLFSRIALLFSNIAFFYPGITLLFSKCLFISQKWSFVFQNCPSVFQKCFIFIYCLRLFPRKTFFFVIISFPCPAQSCSER